MDQHWLYETHGDPLTAVQKFVIAIWEGAQLDGMLAPASGIEGPGAPPRLLEDPGQVTSINPFKPWMALNAANLVPGIMQENPGARLGVIFRPCEMRAHAAMSKQASNTAPPLDAHDNLVTICVDCLATFPVDQVQWRAERKGDTEKLTQEALQFARMGGIAAYRFRSACQMCMSAEAGGADLNIGVLGLPVRQYLLVSARDEEMAQAHHLPEITAGMAGEAILSHRSLTLDRMSERQSSTRERVMHSLGEFLPQSLDAVIQQLEKCDGCQACMDVCPICSVAYPKRRADGGFERSDVESWLASCAGCGMCEQSCPNHLPLSAIFGHIRDILRVVR